MINYSKGLPPPAPCNLGAGRRRKEGSRSARSAFRAERPIHIFGTLGYPVLFLVLLIESVGIPSPSEISLIGAGVLASEGRLSLPLVILTGALGSIAGAHISYFIARRGGRHLILKYGARVGLTDERLRQAEKFFHGRGDIAVLIGRLISGVRAIISYPAGLFDMPYPRFLVFTSIGAVLWPVIAAGAGYLVGPRYKVLFTWISRFWIAILAVAAVALVAYIVVRRRQRKRDSAGA